MSANRLYQTIAAKLRKLIEDGEYPSGSRLPGERELAERFGVSRVTIREAEIALEAQGWIAIRIGSGVYVKPRPAQAAGGLPDISAFDLTAARAVFEAEAAALAASNIDEAGNRPDLIDRRCKERSIRRGQPNRPATGAGPGDARRITVSPLDGLGRRLQWPGRRLGSDRPYRQPCRSYHPQRLQGTGSNMPRQTRCPRQDRKMRQKNRRRRALVFHARNGSRFKQRYSPDQCRRDGPMNSSGNSFPHAPWRACEAYCWASLNR
ncbi:FadR/GntR family transcriptional regulator [Stenotrophomonas sp. 2YAF22]|uniref:FadR/GntR family transcriptional regulator n=1 Tax=Stenotrophomonas sp. 2YAF22 TaxID=3233028 RepID=UPI003F9DD1B8